MVDCDHHIEISEVYICDLEKQKALFGISANNIKITLGIYQSTNPDAGTYQIFARPAREPISQALTLIQDLAAVP